jgi:arabinogalactan endo-1,4-beta-galactosidase
LDTSDSAVAGKYVIGADVTDQEPQPTATRANLLTILKTHGFNWIRLRTFVDPKAADGYDKTNGYDDLTHTIAFGAQIKAAGMGLLLDFHYSDNWADPGKQCIPVAWQGYNATQMAQAVHDYTNNAITLMIAGGARPDMVQVGNEITPGMLIHICDANGQPTSTNTVNGSNSGNNFTNLGAFLKAGINGVHEVDSTITIMLHIDQGGDKPADAGGTVGGALATNKWWINGVQGQGVVFDVMGESSYQAYQGDPNSTANTQATWTSTFDGIATAYPNLKLVAAEYGPMERQINDVVYGLANDQGMGTFDWEPTTQGAWNTGHNLLVLSGTTYVAQTDMALFDAMKTAYASRL